MIESSLRMISPNNNPIINKDLELLTTNNMQFNTKFVKPYENLGRIVVRSSSLFAQSGSANSPHSQTNIVQLIPKNYRFTVKLVSLYGTRKF